MTLPNGPFASGRPPTKTPRRQSHSIFSVDLPVFIHAHVCKHHNDCNWTNRTSLSRMRISPTMVSLFTFLFLLLSCKVLQSVAFDTRMQRSRTIEQEARAENSYFFNAGSMKNLMPCLIFPVAPFPGSA